MSEKEIFVREPTYKLVKLYVEKVERETGRSLSFDGVIYDLFAKAISDRSKITINEADKEYFETIRTILVKINQDNPRSDWEKASYGDLLAFCFNKSLAYFREQYPEEMFELMEKKLICPKSWTKQDKAKFLGFNLEGKVDV